MKYILFCGGGSAGHVVPNLAVMNELRYTHRLAYIGTNGIERSLVSEAGYPFFEVDCPKLIRSLSPKNLTIPFRLAAAEKSAAAILGREKPDLVFSKGGFASYPAARAAQKLGIPVLTHESDLSPGLATKMLAKRCKYVLTSFPETAKLFPNGLCVGSPMRKELFRGERSRARKKYSLSEGKPVLLVLGGGSGSRAINEAVRRHLPKLLGTWQILHLCGKGNLLASPPEGYVQREFEHDMGSAYAACDCVLCRAGSNTAFEALALKKPTLFCPLERASRGDQLQNALYFQRRGLCRIVREESLSALPAALDALRTDDALRFALSACEIESGTQKILSILRETGAQPPSGEREGRSPKMSV